MTSRIFAPYLRGNWSFFSGAHSSENVYFVSCCHNQKRLIYGNVNEKYDCKWWDPLPRQRSQGICSAKLQMCTWKSGARSQRRHSPSKSKAHKTIFEWNLLTKLHSEMVNMNVSIWHEHSSAHPLIIHYSFASVDGPFAARSSCISEFIGVTNQRRTRHGKRADFLCVLNVCIWFDFIRCNLIITRWTDRVRCAHH